MPKCIIGPNGVAHGLMCKDGKLCGHKGNILQSYLKDSKTKSDLLLIGPMSYVSKKLLWPIL
jgi:hypothetical protein